MPRSRRHVPPRAGPEDPATPQQAGPKSKAWRRLRLRVPARPRGRPLPRRGHGVASAPRARLPRYGGAEARRWLRRAIVAARPPERAAVDDPRHLDVDDEPHHDERRRGRGRRAGRALRLRRALRRRARSARHEHGRRRAGRHRPRRHADRARGPRRRHARRRGRHVEPARPGVRGEARRGGPAALGQGARSSHAPPSAFPISRRGSLAPRRLRGSGEARCASLRGRGGGRARARAGDPPVHFGRARAA